MGKIKAGILGGFNGKVGNVIGFAWKGRAVMRSIAQSVHDPKTTKQQLARERFKMILALCDLIGYENLGGGLKAAGNALKKRITAGNEFVKLNYAAIKGSELGNLEVDYEAVIVSKGKCPGVILRGNVTSDDPGSAHIGWINNAGQAGAQDADVVKILAVDPEQGVTAEFSANRSAGSVDLDLPGYMTGHAVTFYVYCISVDGRKVSNSVYAGKATIA